MDGSIEKSEFTTLPYFNLAIPTELNGVDTGILNPKDTYKDPAEWDTKAQDLAKRFVKNFDRFADNEKAKELVKAGPKV